MINKPRGKGGGGGGAFLAVSGLCYKVLINQFSETRLKTVATLTQPHSQAIPGSSFDHMQDAKMKGRPWRFYHVR